MHLQSEIGALNENDEINEKMIPLGSHYRTSFISIAAQTQPADCLGSLEDYLQLCERSEFYGAGINFTAGLKRFGDSHHTGR